MRDNKDLQTYPVGAVAVVPRKSPWYRASAALQTYYVFYSSKAYSKSADPGLLAMF